MSNLPIVLMDDTPPLLSFEKRVIENRNATIESGRFQGREVDVVVVRPHGNNKTAVPHLVDKWLKNLRERLHHKQISKQYYDYCNRAYEAWNDRGEVPLNGTPIATWPVATPLQVDNLRRANLLTVEALAEASEDALESVGMGARELKKKAKIYIEASEGPGKMAMQLSAIEGELDASRRLNEDLMARLEALEKKPKTRKKKE